MNAPLRLMAVLAHPDDESIAVGGALAQYAAMGIEVSLVSATRGERGRYFRNENRPNDREVGRIREAELRSAAAILGIRDVHFLDYLDGDLDEADPAEAIGRIVTQLRRVRPDVVVTFDPFGLYGHPDHVAICQFTTAAVAAAADPEFGPRSYPPHQVTKLYYTGWDEATWTPYQAAFKKLISRVDGDVRAAFAWPRWALTTRIDSGDHWRTVWRAVRCHRTQLAVYEGVGRLTEADHRRLWGSQTFYRALSRVNGGRAVESDLFAGIERGAVAEPDEREEPRGNAA